MGSWEQLDTEVDVQTDTSELDQLINFFKDDPCFAPGVEIAERFKKGIIEGSKKGAYEVADLNRSFQELAIAMHANLGSPPKLINSIKVEKKTETNYLVGTTIAHFYPLCVEYGRREVRPVKAKALRWETLSGKVVFAKKSKASKPYPFVKPAFEQTSREVSDVIKTEIYNATK